jgi:hypothetical protein
VPCRWRRRALSPRRCRGGGGCEVQVERHRQRAPGMDAAILLGTILIAAWAAVVLRGLACTVLAARKGRQWERAYLVGLGVGCTFGVGVVLSIKNSLPFDTFGLSVFLASGAGFAIWALGRSVPAGIRKAPIRSKRQSGEDDQAQGHEGLMVRQTRNGKGRPR